MGGIGRYVANMEAGPVGGMEQALGVGEAASEDGIEQAWGTAPVRGIEQA